ncbi:MAG: TIGR04086 family membrane protein [Clostridia bacterium]
MENTLQAKNNHSVFFVSLKGALIALFISLIGILIFSFAIKYIPISDTAIKPVNQVIKALSILIGCFVALKNARQYGLVSGIIIGLLYTIVSFVVFSILDGNFEFTRVVVNDLFFGGIIGAVCGIIAVNAKRNQQ